MAQFDFTSPDGKSYTVNGPDGATKEQAFAILQRQIGGGTSQPEMPAVDQIDFEGPDLAVNSMIGLLPEDERMEGLTRQQMQKQRKERAELPWYAQPVQGGIDAGVNLARGSIVGSWLDELVGKLHDAIPGGETGEQAMARTRAIARVQDEDHPVASLISKLTGGILTGAPLVSGGRTLAGKVARGVGGGTLYGGVYGAGEGTTTDERIENAQTGAKWGAGLGALAPAVTDVAAPLAARALAPVSRRLADVRDGMQRGAGAGPAADRILSRQIEKAGTSPRELHSDVLRTGTNDLRLDSNSYVNRTTLPSGRVVGNIDETLADQAPSLQRFAGAVNRTGGRAREIVEGTLEGRQRGPRNPFAENQAGEFRGQMGTLEDALSRSLVIRGQPTANRTSQAIMTDMRAQGRELYREAYANSQQFNIRDTLRGFMDRVDDEFDPETAQTFHRVANRFTRQAEDGSRQVVSDVRRFDASKKVLDDEIATAQRAGENNRARLLTELKNDLLEDVHAGGANAEYRAARSAWGSEAERLEAVDMGRNALSADSEMTVDAFQAMSEGNQQLFRVGLRSALRRAQRSKKSGDNAALLMGQQRVQELLAEAIPRTRSTAGTFRNRPERFGEILRRMNRMSGTRQVANGGSQTAANLSDDANLAGDFLGEMANRARQSQSLFGMTVEVVSSVSRRIFGFREEVAEALAQRLMETSPAERMRVLRDIQRAARPGQFNAFVQGLNEAGNRAAQSVTRAATSAEAQAQ